MLNEENLNLIILVVVNRSRKDKSSDREETQQDESKRFSLKEEK